MQDAVAPFACSPFTSDSVELADRKYEDGSSLNLGLPRPRTGASWGHLALMPSRLPRGDWWIDAIAEVVPAFSGVSGKGL